MGKAKQTLETFRGLDPVKDFHEPTRRESYLGKQEEPRAPLTVFEGKVVAQFVRLTPDRDEDGERILHWDFSAPITNEMAAALPEPFQSAYELMTRGTPKILRLAFRVTSAVNVKLYLAPDDAASLGLAALVPERCWMQVVEEEGSGKAQRVTRLSFRLTTECASAPATWAFAHYGDLIWIKVEEVNARLPLAAATAAL